MPTTTHQRTALVTGASRGIGRAIALELARGGHRLVLHEHEPGSGAETDALLRAAHSEPRWIHGDLARPVGAGDTDEPGGLGDLAGLEIDVLVHNASAFAPYGRVEDGAREADAEVLGVALTAGIGLARAVTPGMRARGFGRLVFIGSAAGRLGAAGQVAYATAKAGLLGLTRSLAVELGRAGITCNLVEPGLIDTERTRAALSGAQFQALAASTPVGRAGNPEELARLVAFLASDDAGYVTGAAIPADGGLGLGVVPRNQEPPC
ncbi:MAG: SDR family oxidoreductase [Planctomycetota bacterium]|nr:SDR family oxidoreductase [Planctomycetota bacterium]